MPLEYQDTITRNDLRINPDKLYVFGDNLQGRGYGGQAREMRDEPNAVGIPTKRAPGRNPEDYFNDYPTSTDWDDYIVTALPKWVRLLDHLEVGGTVILPKAGIGTGLAMLKTKHTRIWDHVQAWVSLLGRAVRCKGM